MNHPTRKTSTHNTAPPLTPFAALRRNAPPLRSSLRPHCPLPTAHCPLPRAFTLVELLVTVSIIAILATLFLGALYTAQDQARAIKTKSTIAKLNTIIMARWDSYKTRRVPITIPAGTPPNVAAAMRLTALRELMRLELPDRNADIPPVDPPMAWTSSPFTFNWTDQGGTAHTRTITVPRPSVSYAYKRRWGTPASGDALHGAECLYLIVTSSQDEDTAGRELFGESEVGDYDGDGRPEFKDAWGNPISFVRWPAGFVSELQPLIPGTSNRDVVNNHDPFDTRRVDVDAYALYPLIFSPGPDGKYEIFNGSGYDYYPTAASNNGVLDPYSPPPSAPQIGGWSEPSDNQDGVNDSIDNIHNHLMGTR